MDIKKQKYDEKLRSILEDTIEDESLKKIIHEKENFDLFEDLEFDSLQIMIFLSAVEENFNIELIGNNDVIEIMNNYKKLLEWLENNTQNEI